MLIASASGLQPHRQRLWLAGGAFVSMVVAASVWWIGLHSLVIVMPVEWGEPELAFGCCAVAALFGPMLGIEAVSHERLLTPAVNPLAGYTSPTLELNQLFLRGSIEQWVIFAAGILGLAATAPSTFAARSILVATLVWIVARLAFRIGYMRGSEFRGFGLAAHAQSLLILLYVTDRVATAIAGTPARIAALLLFFVAEAALVLQARSSAKKAAALSPNSAG